MQHLPPDYLGHDKIYQKLRARDANGWNNEDDDAYTEMHTFIAPDLPVVAPSARVETLEIGCGAGNFSLLLAQQGYALTGVDISPTAIAWALERARAIDAEVSFRVDNVLHLSQHSMLSLMATVCIASSVLTAPRP